MLLAKDSVKNIDIIIDCKPKRYSQYPKVKARAGGAEEYETLSMGPAHVWMICT